MLLVLKNGPLCLAVYGERDLVGLPSTDNQKRHDRHPTELCVGET